MHLSPLYIFRITDTFFISPYADSNSAIPLYEQHKYGELQLSHERDHQKMSLQAQVFLEHSKKNNYTFKNLHRQIKKKINKIMYKSKNRFRVIKTECTDMSSRNFIILFLFFRMKGLITSIHGSQKNTDMTQTQSNKSRS